MPRIISGGAKGLILKAPKDKNTRPTSDRTKEALFSILHTKINDAIVVDIFSGTGSLGLEAISRGSNFCYFIDYNRNCCNIIKENIAKCHMNDKSKVLMLKANKAIEYLASIKVKANLIFLDPPYDKGFVNSTIEKIFEFDIIDETGIIICEHSQKEIPKENFNEFTCIDKRKYGIACISIYMRK